MCLLRLRLFKDNFPSGFGFWLSALAGIPAGLFCLFWGGNGVRASVADPDPPNPYNFPGSGSV